MTASVFAGLGSAALFSNSTQLTALADAACPEAQALLKACHTVFLTEIRSSDKKGEAEVGIDLEDFQHSKDLLKPPVKYHKNAAIQNATLNLVQSLRYLAWSLESAGVSAVERSGAAGVCSGLLAAVAVASYGDTLQYLSYAQQSFRISLLLGLHIEGHVRMICGAKPIEIELYPWSIILDGLETEQTEDIISQHRKALRDFCRHALPENCKVRPTNIFAPYHGAKTLGLVKNNLLQDCARRGVDFPSWDDLKVPLYYGKDASFGKPALSGQSLLEFVLDLILIHPVDWAATQDRILADMARAKKSTGLSEDILNFGPGYGVSRVRAQGYNILDVSTNTSSKRKKDFALDDIAIVGMAVDFPGATDLDGLWDVLANGLNTVSEIPDSRFHVEDFQHHGQQSTQNPKRSMKTKFGNFIGDSFQFDASFFCVSPREAKSIDPQQRILLQTTYKALENAGYVPDTSPSYARETFGCYIGNATLDYTANLKDEIDVGHCEAASGAAGLAKLLLMMQNRTIPAQISLDMLNPRIAPLGTDGTYIARKAIE
ncbi:MAG: hypothetical protein Q9167_004843 [Letrouitia subvulpina]